MVLKILSGVNISQAHEGFVFAETNLRSVNPSVFGVLLDQPSRPGEDLRWNYHTNLLCCLKIDNKLKLCRLLHRQIGGLCAFQYPVHVICDAPVILSFAGRIGYETASLYPLSSLAH